MRIYLPFQPPILQHELSDSNYRYREFAPSKSLESYVACYWTVEFHASETDKLHRIIPDGCVDIIFDLNSPSFSKGAFVVGLMTQFETMNLSQNCSIFGIRFFSDTVRLFVKYPVSEFIGTHVLIEDIWGNEAEFMLEEMISATGISEIIERVEFECLKFLLLNESKSDGLLQTSMQYMYASQGMISIRALAENLSYSMKAAGYATAFTCSC